MTSPEPPGEEVAALSPSYVQLLAAAKAEVQAARLRVARSANTEMITHYWRLGRLIQVRQQAEG